jgi:Ca2+-binding RTX toxin-like protein
VQAVVEGLYLILQTAGGDTLRLLRYFTADATGGRIEMIRFADGTQWDRAFVYGMVSRIVGTESDDYLYGMSFDSELRGLAGNDVLFGYGGSDLLDGGTGDDSLTGSDGNDTYVVDSTADTITEYAGEGTDTVQSSVTWTLSSTLENLTLTGNAHINGTGNTSANVLTGNAGNNTLDGKAGADTLAGGAGDDVYTVDNVGDTVTEGAGEGTDRVNGGVSFTLGAHVENLTLTGTSALNGTGNVLANSLVGNSGANRLDGGAGVDTLAGGTGNDTYVVDDTADVVTENASAGTDTVESSATFTLGSNVEHLTLTGAAAVNATGNTAANTLRGNAAANVLDGKGGTDTMIGGAGDDTYVVDVSTDVTTENASEGTDTVHSAVTRTLGNYLENLTLTGTAAINGTGNTLDNVLVGNSANNTLAGLVGNDIYVGGLGNDTLNDNSTTSNDVYRFGRGDGQDTLTDAGGSADRIEIGAGVSSSQLTQTRSGNNLVLGISGTTDTLTIVNWYASAANRIEEILLADGGTVTPASAGGLTTVKFGAPAPARTLAWRGASPETDRQAALLIESMAQFAAPSMAEPGEFMQPVKQPLPMVAANEWWLSK